MAPILTDRAPVRIAVIGGGISGLSAAHRLNELAGRHRLNFSLRLYEASDRTGGVISTITRDGFVIEEGPDSIITDKPAARDLAERLGLADRIVGTQTEWRRSFIVRNGRPRPTPDGFYLMAPSQIRPLLFSGILGPAGILRAAIEPLVPVRRQQQDESVGSFVQRRLGRQVLDRMAQPMIGGIYGADPFELSLEATFPRFRAMEREHGSVIRALIRQRKTSETRASGARYGLFISFDRGLQVLTDTLVSRLPTDQIRRSSPVDELRFENEGWAIRSGGLDERFEAVILALPSHGAARLLEPLDPSLSGDLTAIPYGSAATVSLAYPEEAISHPLDGFGFVVPSTEGLGITGCSFMHRKYPGRAPHGAALLRAFWGDLSGQISDDEMLARTVRELQLLLGGLSGVPLLAHVSRWPGSMPRYKVGHPTLAARILARAEGHRRLALAGNAYGGVGIPDCVSSGESAAEKIIARLFPSTSAAATGS